jgi:DeoD family purine-nucleoside phosphorylase
MPAVIHIHQTAELAERVLLPGDPGRALRMAPRLLSEPKMLNHNRGLWGYTGTAADGARLSIQSTGMGGPSAAIVVHELIELGAERLVRVGTCGGLVQELTLGQLLIAGEALSDDGTSRALGAHAPLARVPATPELLRRLREASGRSPLPEAIADGPVVSTDLFYDAGDRHAAWVSAGAVAVDMEAATLFTIAARKGVQAACALLVASTLHAGAEQISEPALHQAELELGELAVGSLPAL